MTMTPTLWKTLLAGTALGGLRVAFAIPIYLILTPLILRVLGAELFGLWSLNATILTVLNMMDLGLKNSLAYHVARDQNQPHATSQHLTTGFASYTIVGLTILVGTFLSLEPVITMLLQIPPALQDAARFTIVITAVTFVVRMLSLPFQSVLEGHQQWWLTQTLLLGWLITHAITTGLALWLRPDIYGLGLAGLVSNTLLAGGCVLALRVHLPHVRLQVEKLRWRHVSPLWRYGTGIQIAMVAITLREPLYKVVLARSYDLVALGTFEIANRLCIQFMSLFALPFMAVLTVSARFAERPRDLEAFLRPLALYSLACLPPLVFITFATSEILFSWWLGDDGWQPARLFPFLLAGFAMYYVSEIFYKSIEGSGRSWYSATIQPIILGIQVTILAITPPSLWSLAASLIAGCAVFTLVNLWMFRRCHPSIRVFSQRQLAWLLTPSVGYLALMLGFPEAVGAGLLGLYLCTHLVAVKQAAGIDVGTWLTRFVRSGSRFTTPEVRT